MATKAASFDEQSMLEGDKSQQLQTERGARIEAATSIYNLAA